MGEDNNRGMEGCMCSSPKDAPFSTRSDEKVLAANRKEMIVRLESMFKARAASKVKEENQDSESPQLRAQ